MVTTEDLLIVLSDGKYHSGTVLGQRFDVSRAAICKVIQKIEMKYSLTIFAVKGKGYRLQQPFDFLDKKKIRANLSNKTSKQLNEFKIFFDIDSTNHYLNIKSLDGAPTGYVVLAEQQTKGQGRRGKTWVSPFASNLYLSLLWRFQFGPAQLACMSLFMGIAVVRALNKFGVEDAGVKWPNDIYWKNKKLAGILLEMRGEANGPSTVVIGLGLNIAMTNENTQASKKITQPWISLEAIIGEKVDRNYFTSLIINALFEVLNDIPFKQMELLSEWQRMDVLKDKKIDVQFADKSIKGIALGINRDGALRVLHNNKEILCHSGDVSIRRND